MKQVITWSLILVVLFVVFIGLAFVALTYMTPSPEDMAGKEVVLPPMKDSTQTAKSGLTPSDSLQQIVENLTNDLFFVRVSVDSLNNLLEQKEALIQGYLSQVETLEKSNLTLKNKNISIKELAKTYETMKVAEIKPIMEKLDDKTIAALYKNMGTRTRKNLIQALSSARAAQLTQKMAGMSP